MAIKSRMDQELERRKNMNVRQDKKDDQGRTVYSKPTAAPKTSIAPKARPKPASKPKAAPQAKPQSQGPSKRPTKAGAAKNKAVGQAVMQALALTSSVKKIGPR